MEKVEGRRLHTELCVVTGEVQVHEVWPQEPAPEDEGHLSWAEQMGVEGNPELRR